MAERSGSVGRTLRDPKISGMVVLLLLLVAGYVANYFFVSQDATRSAAYLRQANNLKVLSQEIAKNSSEAAGGQVQIFPLLMENRSQFDDYLGYLKNGNLTSGLPASPEAQQSILNRVTSLWSETRTNIDVILGNRDALVSIRDMSGDLAITMSAIQQENNKVVAAMLRAGKPANEVVLAQRQSQIIERMSRGIDKVMEFGGAENFRGNFDRDSATFARVLQGLTNGDRDLLLTAANDAEVQASLLKIDELFRSVSSRMNEIFARAQEVVAVGNAAQAVYLGSGDYLDLLNSLTRSYEESQGQGLASPLLGLGCAIGAFLVIVIMGVFIAQEVRRSVQETQVQNEQNQAAILQLLDELADLADGDLRVQATVTESFTGAIADSINFSIDQMRALVSKINETSGQVSTAADQTRRSVSELSEASQRQSKEITDVSEAVNEMAISIDQVSYNAAESSSVAERSVEIASQGAVVVQNTIGGMDKIRGQIQETAKRIKRLGESSQEIGDIVSLINDIADQTNILSLNAAIQASMAGDAGKGFAVVADEVQRLAERSGAAAKQISALVKTIQSDTNEAVTSMEQTTAEVVQGTKLAQDAGVSLGEIESVSKSLAEIIENISDAARQQAASAGKISNTMKSIQEITSQTTEGTKSTATAVGNLADMTNELRSSVTGFKLPE
ncbi:MAG: type IV pili methyl-accepting chemotaxis transducer N-terminal domain-containing protein [Pseudomonadales bacterium]|nr:type IV pili methyl-accepting chemotaxis transducer N-terminal domain-containing protein [Pseudomonadales bacterium]